MVGCSVGSCCAGHHAQAILPARQEGGLFGVQALGFFVGPRYLDVARGLPFLHDKKVRPVHSLWTTVVQHRPGALHCARLCTRF